MSQGWAEKLPEDTVVGRRNRRVSWLRYVAIGAAGGLGLLAAFGLGLFTR